MVRVGPGRGLLALGVALALVAGACGSSSSTPNPFGLPGVGGNNGGNNGGNGASLTSGLSSNLDQLTSYKFTWSLASASTGAGNSPGETGSFGTSGTVINKPTPAYAVTSLGIQYIQIGTQQWTSFDGNTWTASDATGSSVKDFLPTKDYGTWFDAKSTDFKVAGEESKNGVQCIHFKGDSSLGAMYQGITGVSASFQAELWVAKEGNYPVSGIYGVTASAGGQGGSFGYSFDITNVNDPANKVTAPTNVIALPS